MNLLFFSGGILAGGCVQAWGRHLGQGRSWGVRMCIWGRHVHDTILGWGSLKEKNSSLFMFYIKKKKQKPQFTFCPASAGWGAV